MNVPGKLPAVVGVDGVFGINAMSSCWIIEEREVKKEQDAIGQREAVDPEA